MTFKVGEVYNNPYINSTIEVLQVYERHAIMEVRYLTHEFERLRGRSDSFHMASPFARGLVRLKYMETPLWKLLEGDEQEQGNDE